MKSFHMVLSERGIDENVVTYLTSGFARILNAKSNEGSDRTWGSNPMVMGSLVKGGKTYDRYPASLTPGNPLDVGFGRLIPTTSVDNYTAELARWFGLDNDSVPETIIPNRRNFYSASDPNIAIGFLPYGIRKRC